MFVAPSDDQIEADADANRTIGDIECRPVMAAKCKVEKIHNLAMAEPVHHITGNATGDQTERNNITGQVNLKRPAEKADHDECDNRDDRQNQVGILKQSPRRARIAPVDQAKKTIHH